MRRWRDRRGCPARVINESRNLAETRERVGLSERRILLDWWVLHAMIVVEPIPGMRRANHKSAVFALRSAPDAPKYFALGRQPESVSDSSSRTLSSSSTNRRDVSASRTSDATSGGQPPPDAMQPPPLGPLHRGTLEAARELLLRQPHQLDQPRAVDAVPREKRRLRRGLRE